MPSRNQPWAWTEQEDERLRAYVAQGASVVKVAAALKRKIISVRTHARAIGCPFPPLIGRFSALSLPTRLLVVLARRSYGEPSLLICGSFAARL
jgi:hypothetical protein